MAVTISKQSQVHPILSILEELTHMSSLELDLQRKTKLLGDLKIEMMQLLDEQREKDFDFVKMEEALQMATSQMDHMKGELQNKVDCLEKELKVSTKKMLQSAAEASQLRLSVQSLQDSLHNEKERVKISAENISLLKGNIELKRSSVLDMERKLNTEKLHSRDLKSQLESSRKALEEKEDTLKRCKTKQSKGEDHQIVVENKKLQVDLRKAEEKLQSFQKNESALTARLSSLDMQIKLVNSEVAALARPWIKGDNSTSSADALTCVREMNLTLKDLKHQTVVTEERLQNVLTQNVIVTGQIEKLKTTFQIVSQDTEPSPEYVDEVLPAILRNLKQMGDASPSSNCSTESIHSEELSAVQDDETQSSHFADLTTTLWTLLSNVKERLFEYKAQQLQLCLQLRKKCEECGLSTEGMPLDQIVRCFDRLTTVERDVKDLSDRLTSSKHNHEISMSAALSALRSDSQKDIQEAVEKTRMEEREAARKELARREGDITERLSSTVVQKDKEISNLMQVLESAQQESKSSLEKVETDKNHIQRLLQNLANKDKEIDFIKSSLAVVEGSKEERITELLRELNEVQEVSNQHALTIVAMEQKLLTSVHRIASLEDRLAVQKVNSWNGDSPTVSLGSSLVHPSDDEKGTLHCEGVTETKRTDGNHEEEPGLKNIKADLEKEREELKQTIRILKKQHSLSLAECRRLEARVTELQETIKSDNDTFESKYALMNQKHEREFADLNRKLSKQEEELTENSQKMSTLQENLRNKNTQISSLEDTIRSIQDQKDQYTEDSDISASKQRERPHTSYLNGHSNLSEVGAACLSERHSQIIQQQKQTLKDLRFKLKEIKENKPPNPSQLALLQKTQELSYRLNAYKSVCDTEDPKDLSAANGVDIDTQTQHGVDLDKMSPLDLQDIQNSLGACEYMLIELLFSLAKSLSYEPAPPKETVLQVTQSERPALISERRKFVKVLSSEVDKLVKILHANKRLLEGARKEVAKLKLSERECMENTASTVSLAEEQSKRVRDLNDELQVALEELDQQKRLNEALVRRQHHSEGPYRGNTVPLSHSCFVSPEEVKHKLSHQQRSYSEQLKKKKLQINGLKKELHVTSQKLDATTMRLKQVEGRRH